MLIAVSKATPTRPFGAQLGDRASRVGRSCEAERPIKGGDAHHPVLTGAASVVSYLGLTCSNA